MISPRMARLLMKHKIVNYFRYVDILMIFDPNHSNIDAILDDFNALHPNLQFTAEVEENNTISYFRFMVPCITYQYLINQHDAAGQ